jgi:hypothetical protein
LPGVGWIKQHIVPDFKFLPAAVIMAAGFIRARRQQKWRAHNPISGEKNMRKRMKRSFANARTIARKAVAKLPESTKRGFHDGLKTGHDFIGNTPYIVGAVGGFVFGVSEAVVDLAASAIGWAWAGEEEVAAETA